MHWPDLLEALDATPSSWATRARLFANAFWKNGSPLTKDELMGALEENAAQFPIETTLCAVFTVRRNNPFMAARIARRLISYDVTSHGFRYVLVDCLRQSPFIDDRLEAFKQLLLGHGLRIQHLLTQPDGVVEANELRAAHRDEWRRFESGLRANPGKTPRRRRVTKLLRRSVKLSPPLAQRLLEIPDRAGLPLEQRPTPHLRVVVDEGSITNRLTDGLLKDWRVEHVAPAFVLLALAAHPRIELIPWGLHYVRFVADPLHEPRPHWLFRWRKPKTLATNARKIGALAAQVGAHAILSDDPGLRATRGRAKVVQPEDYDDWLDQRAPRFPPSQA
ncbi:MAG TPA: hypothetical protein VGB18_00915 [Candidatus Thermoplasmatota archaeon]